MATKFDDRLKEKLEVLAGDRGAPRDHALRAGQVADIDALIGALNAGTQEIAARVAAILSRLALAEAEMHAALAQLGDLQAGLGDLPRHAVRFSGAPGESVSPSRIGDVVFEFTTDGTLTIKGRGGDGVVRSGTVALT